MTNKTTQPAMPDTCYMSAVKRVRKADTVEVIDQLSDALVRVYDAGFLTAEQLSELDGKLMDKKANLQITD